MGIALILILAFIVYTMYNNGTISVKPSNRSDEAMTALTNRFIAGEIDESTYLRMKKVLNN
jgi:uncharacterized membrane protein